MSRAHRAGGVTAGTLQLLSLENPFPPARANTGVTHGLCRNGQAP